MTNPRDPAGDPEGIVRNREDLEIGAILRNLADGIMAKLHKQYPGFRWEVGVDPRGHVINIRCPVLHNTWGYIIRTLDIMDDPRLRLATIAGGEILERFGWKHRNTVGRLCFDLDYFMGLPKDSIGEVKLAHIGDTRKRVSKTEKNRHRIEKAIAEGKVNFGRTAKGELYVGIIKD